MAINQPARQDNDFTYEEFRSQLAALRLLIDKKSELTAEDATNPRNLLDFFTSDKLRATLNSLRSNYSLKAIADLEGFNSLKQLVKEIEELEYKHELIKKEKSPNKKAQATLVDQTNKLAGVINRKYDEYVTAISKEISNKISAMDAIEKNIHAFNVSSTEYETAIQDIDSSFKIVETIKKDADKVLKNDTLKHEYNAFVDTASKPFKNTATELKNTIEKDIKQSDKHNIYNNPSKISSLKVGDLRSLQALPKLKTSILISIKNLKDSVLNFFTNKEKKNTALSALHNIRSAVLHSLGIQTDTASLQSKIDAAVKFEETRHRNNKDAKTNEKLDPLKTASVPVIKSLEEQRSKLDIYLDRNNEAALLFIPEELVSKSQEDQKNSSSDAHDVNKLLREYEKEQKEIRKAEIKNELNQLKLNLNLEEVKAENILNNADKFQTAPQRTTKNCLANHIKNINDNLGIIKNYDERISAMLNKEDFTDNDIQQIDQLKVAIEKQRNLLGISVQWCDKEIKTIEGKERNELIAKISSLQDRLSDLKKDLSEKTTNAYHAANNQTNDFFEKEKSLVSSSGLEDISVRISALETTINSTKTESSKSDSSSLLTQVDNITQKLANLEIDSNAAFEKYSTGLTGKSQKKLDRISSSPELAEQPSGLNTKREIEILEAKIGHLSDTLVEGKHSVEQKASAFWTKNPDEFNRIQSSINRTTVSSDLENISAQIDELKKSTKDLSSLDEAYLKKAISTYEAKLETLEKSVDTSLQSYRSEFTPYIKEEKLLASRINDLKEKVDFYSAKFEKHPQARTNHPKEFKLLSDLQTEVNKLSQGTLEERSTSFNNLQSQLKHQDGQLVKFFGPYQPLPKVSSNPSAIFPSQAGRNTQGQPPTISPSPK